MNQPTLELEALKAWLAERAHGMGFTRLGVTGVELPEEGEAPPEAELLRL